MRAWKRMPDSFGPHWFTTNLDNRDLAFKVDVEFVQHGNDAPFYARSGFWPSESGRITPDIGWWLKIPDERRTAPIEQEAAVA